MNNTYKWANAEHTRVIIGNRIFGNQTNAWKVFEEWLAEGNEPLPADEPADEQ